MSRAIDVDVSLMRDRDLNFVASGWKRSHRDAPQNAGIPLPKYFDRVGRLFDMLMARRGVTVLVARDPGHPDTLFGFACFEQRGPAIALHYVYARREFKRMGVASQLLLRALEGAQDGDELVYTAGSRFDALWERWGFRRVVLEDWLRERPDLTEPDPRRGRRAGGVR